VSTVNHTAIDKDSVSLLSGMSHPTIHFIYRELGWIPKVLTEKLEA